MSPDQHTLERIVYVLVKRYTSGRVWVQPDELEESQPQQLVIDSNDVDGGLWLDIVWGDTEQGNAM